VVRRVKGGLKLRAVVDWLTILHFEPPDKSRRRRGERKERAEDMGGCRSAGQA
jgi:hypothetical protein